MEEVKSSDRLRSLYTNPSLTRIHPESAPLLEINKSVRLHLNIILFVILNVPNNYNLIDNINNAVIIDDTKKCLKKIGFSKQHTQNKSDVLRRQNNMS